MTKTRCTVLALVILVIAFCEGQLHYLKYIDSGTPSATNVLPQFTSEMSKNQTNNIRNKLANAERICVSGMWALYNTTDFGEGAEDSTTVVSVRGTDINTCTRAGQIPVLKSGIQSLVYLGNADYSKNGLLIYSQPYLLGGLWNVTVFDNNTVNQLPPEISGFPLGSLAITGKRHWLICGDRNSPCSRGVCVNMSSYGNLFLQRNVSNDSGVANGWPKVVRSVRIVSPNECFNYPRPEPVNPRKIFRRDISAGVEIVLH